MKKPVRIAMSLFIFLLSFFTLTNVNAEERKIYYTNNNGVELTKDEYDFLTEVYWNGYQSKMTQDEYDYYRDGDYFGGEVEKKIVYDTPLTRGTFHSTPNKAIQISKTCNTTCSITIGVEWINNPTIRSYDVIGAYLYNTRKIGTVSAYATTNNNSNFASITNVQTNGFGSSVLLPSGSNVHVYQTFSVAKGGRVYGSYQHAIKNTTLAVSQKYNIDITGYGSVFGFYGDAVNTYDNMNGVDITV